MGRVTPEDLRACHVRTHCTAHILIRMTPIITRICASFTRLKTAQPSRMPTTVHGASLRM